MVDLSQENIKQLYMDLLQPHKLVAHFDEVDFAVWLRESSDQEIEWCLEAFEKEELYKWCTLIKREQDSRG